MRHRYISPLTWPALSFALVIFIGALLLWWPLSHAGDPVPFIDALFVSTSAVCVTGLSTVDVGARFNTLGHGHLLLLMQLGGLGITTYTSLLALLWRQRVPITDRLAVSQALWGNANFDLGQFLRRIVAIVLCIEAAGAFSLWLWRPDLFSPFSAAFHAVSAFCNAGFSLFSNNLEGVADDVPVNLTIMLLIITGGLGFAVLNETRLALLARLRKGAHVAPPLSRYARLVFRTTALLIVGGALGILGAELLRPDTTLNGRGVLTALFQSVTSRTAGFNTVPMASLSDTALLVIMVLMFVGGAPGSCAGGVKVTTFRVLWGFVGAQITGKRQVVLEGRAVSAEGLRQALVLFFFSATLVAVSVLVLTWSEGVFGSHAQHPNPLLDMAFEVVSAFGTVGLSTGLTAGLSSVGKSVIILNMFVGRVGLITLLAALQSLHSQRTYDYPETYLPIG